MAKKELTITEFRAIIKEEALKLKKRIVLENEKKTLQAELNSLLNESYMEEGEVEEGAIRNFASKVTGGMVQNTDQNMEAKKQAMQQQFNNFQKKYGTKVPTPELMAQLMQQAAADNYAGRATYNLQTKELAYYPSTKKDTGPGMNTKGGGSMY